jgi:hypothetical protein
MSTNVRVVGVGHSDAMIALDVYAEVRVFSTHTLVLETTGMRRISLGPDGEIRDALITDRRERELLTRLFNEDG